VLVRRAEEEPRDICEEFSMNEVENKPTDQHILILGQITQYFGNLDLGTPYTSC
tara:strand:- start:531 stop:692 length:162 start_codon:yes stop_codon:yes gene_type:complete